MAREINDKFLSKILQDTKECYGKNGRRVFIVEDVKYAAIKALEDILKTEAPRSFLMLVKDKTIAYEVAGSLSQVTGGCIVIDSLEEITALIGVDDREIFHSDDSLDIRHVLRMNLCGHYRTGKEYL